MPSPLQDKFNTFDGIGVPQISPEVRPEDHHPSTRLNHRNVSAQCRPVQETAEGEVADHDLPCSVGEAFFRKAKRTAWTIPRDRLWRERRLKAIEAQAGVNRSLDLNARMIP